LLPALLAVFGLYFAWDAYRSLRAGSSNAEWGFSYSRAEAPASFWTAVGVEVMFVVLAWTLALYIAAH